jgi:N-acyl-D-aspartate/D-glutamate deacylase
MLSRVMAEAKTATACMAFDIPKSGDLIDYGLETLSMVANISRQRITYLLIGNDADDPMSYLQTVKKLGGLLDSGAVTPQCMVKPLTLLFHMKSPFTLATFSNSLRSLLGKPFEEQMKHYADPGFRAAVLKEIDETPFFKGFFDRVWVIGGESEEAKGLSKTDKTLATIAKERGVNPIDCWLDIALRDQLETRFGFAAAAYEPEGVKNLIRDGRFLPGVADAGAHLTSINDAGYVTHMLGHWCRDKQVVPLEEAVRLTTSFAADVFGVERRGRIVKGNYADLVLFEFEKVGACKAEYVNDLPGGARRMISRATGVNATIVNGQVLYENAIHSGALPGTMLRSQAQ